MRIYGIKDNLKNKIVYVGKTKNPKDYKPHGRHILKICKSNPERYTYEILEQVQDITELDNREIYYIAHYNTFEDAECFNFTRGGGGGCTLGKYTEEERRKIKAKELQTKANNPNIMKETARKARETFLKRPKEEIDLINKERIRKSLVARLKKRESLSEEEKNLAKQKHSLIVKEIHQRRTIEEKKIIREKISNTLSRDCIRLINKNTGEIKELTFTQWKKLYKVDIYHLKSDLQKTSHGWLIP